jgi:hypothetical protein
MEDGKLEEMLRSSLANLAATKGPCPAVEELSHYRDDRVTAETKAQIDRHLAACGICEALLEQMDRFDAAMEAGKSGGAPHTLRRQSLFVYSFVAAVLLGGILLLPRWTARVPPGEHRPPAEFAPSFVLSQTRAAGDGAILLGPEEAFVLTFFAPMIEGKRYFATIRDEAGRGIVDRQEIASRDARGNVTLVCQRRAFAPGTYTIIINEDGSDVGQSAYVFRIAPEK